MLAVTGEDVRALAIGAAGSLAAWSMLQRVRVRYDWSPHISERVASETELSRYAVKVRRHQSERWVARRLRALRRRLGGSPREVVDASLHPGRPRARAEPGSGQRVRARPAA
jgi:hypothetical protein